MADHFARPERAATSRQDRLAALHALCDADYANAAPYREHTHNISAFLAPAALMPAQDVSDLAVAIGIGQRMLAAYSGIGAGDLDGMTRAHGALTESLRILLRALGAEGSTDQ